MKNEQYNGNGCENCPYDGDQALCRERLYKDALVLLDSATKVIVEKEEAEWNNCGYCHNHLIHKWDWCPYCGRGILW